jgi:hypothetical protein
MDVALVAEVIVIALAGFFLRLVSYVRERTGPVLPSPACATNRFPLPLARQIAFPLSRPRDKSLFPLPLAGEGRVRAIGFDVSYGNLLGFSLLQRRFENRPTSLCVLPAILAGA